MFTHNFSPILFDLGFIAIRWYSLAYIFGIIVGWWYAKKIIQDKFTVNNYNLGPQNFDDLITYLVFAIIIGGRIGYIFFYNFEYFLVNPLSSFKIWEGGMSFHGALIGIIIATYFFSIKNKIKTFILLDLIACVSPIGIFLGRIANFINGELVGKVTDVKWSVIFPQIDMMPRHPSQLYEALLEGLLLFIILNTVIFRENYKIGKCSCLFLIFYGTFRIFSELFREPDFHIGYIFDFLSMGTILSILMIIIGIIIFNFLKKRNEI